MLDPLYSLGKMFIVYYIVCFEPTYLQKLILFNNFRKYFFPKGTFITNYQTKLSFSLLNHFLLSCPVLKFLISKYCVMSVVILLTKAQNERVFCFCLYVCLEIS